MKEYDPDWSRWCIASIILNFKNTIGDVPFFVEGMARQTEHLAEYFELRIDGPYVRESAKEQWRLYFEVNVLVVTNMDLMTSIYRHDELKGLASKSFTNNIEVKRHGERPVDDGTRLGFLRRRSRGQERIQISEFGQIRPDVRLKQATVEGHYDIYID